MSDEKRIDIAIGDRLYQFRSAVVLSLNSLSKIIGISQSTLSRIEGNTHGILFENIKILSEAFGISTLQFQDRNFQIPNKKKLIEALKLYVKNHNRDVDVNVLVNGLNTAYYLDKYIAEGFLDELKSMSQIRVEIKNEYNVELSGAQMSKLLAKRHEWGTIARRSGEKKGTYKYKNIQKNNKG